MLNQLILGIGLFFLGMQLVGDYMRRLSGPSFRSLIRKYTRIPPIDAVIGIGFGALTQSATAVTFTLVSMVRSRLIISSHALPIILGSNVGLTILAFLIVLNIHPLIAWWIGCAAIIVTFVRRPISRSIAGVLLGIGLILLGLQEMGQGAAILKSSTWFQHFLNIAHDTPLFAFAIGVIAAALLQSNTGATLLIITISTAGGMDLKTALPLVYGTNLGAIALRLYLAINLHGEDLRLVRFEDAFCVFSGILMLTLYFLEEVGIPLVISLITLISSSIHTQLAFGFLLSNLLPALLLYPFRDRLFAALAPITPESLEDLKSRPKYLSDAALGDPSTALDLQAKELCRLFRMITIKPHRTSIAAEDQPDPAFKNISEAIERFGAQLAGNNGISQADARFLHQLRVGLSLTRHLEEAVRGFCENLAEASDEMLPFENTLSAKLTELLAEAGDAMECLQISKIDALRDHTRRSNPELHSLRHEIMKTKPQPNSKDTARTLELLDHFELSVWLLHRFVKVLEDLSEPCTGR